MTKEHFWTLDTATLTCFRTLYPRIQRGHWRYFGTQRWTKATWIIPGGERNTVGNTLESAIDWGKGLTVLLTPSVPDTTVTSSDNFSVLRMDRTAEAGKTKSGGVCFMINKKWCDPRNISILSRSCSPHLEHLSIVCHPFYLPRDFSSIVITAVYIPPQADTSLALSKLHDVLSGYINKHPDAASIIARDFNKANLWKVMPNFHQHVSCPSRGHFPHTWI